MGKNTWRNFGIISIFLIIVYLFIIYKPSYEGFEDSSTNNDSSATPPPPPPPPPPPTICPDNFTIINNTCVECSQTQKSQGGITPCENLNCPVNQKASGHVCVACAQGTYSSGGSSSSCTSCSAGMYINNGVCSTCEPGTFTSTEGKTSCTSCIPGTYNDKSGSTTCTNCPSGQYQDADGKKECKKCEAGTYQSQTGQTVCITCPAGKYTNTDGMDKCSRCQTGYYQNKAGQKSCIICPKNTYADTSGSEECTPCPAGKFTNDVGARSATDCLRKITTSDCIDIYNDSQLSFDSSNAPTGKTLYYGLNADNFTLLTSSSTYNPSDSVDLNISKCVLDKRLEDRSDVCKSNSPITINSCGTAITNSKSLLQAYEFVNSKGICVNMAGTPIPYPTLNPPGTTGGPDDVLAHIVSCTNPRDAKTCSYNFPIGGVTHQTNPCTSRNLIYDFESEDCVDPSVNTIGGTSNNCENHQVFDAVTGRCLDVIVPIKSMPPNTKGRIVQGDYRDCKTTTMGDCTVVYKNKASDITKYASTSNPCPVGTSLSNTVYNFDTYSCEPPSTQAFMDYVTANKTNYHLERPIIG